MLPDKLTPLRQKYEMLKSSNNFYRRLLAGLLALIFFLIGGVSMAKQNKAAQDINRFSTDLYSQLSREKGNLFVSPYSVFSALSMSYAGADGKTAEELKTALRFNQSPREYGNLIDQLNRDNEYYKLIAANALWGQKGLAFRGDYLNILKNEYRSELRQLDFMKDPEKARLTINNWVEDKTNKKIKDLLPPRSIGELTRLILTNAVYFKAEWSDRFEKGYTKDAVFHVSDTKQVKAGMMYKSQYFSYFENNDLQMVELPYKGIKTSMLIILPRKIDGIGAVEKDFSQSNLEDWQKNALRCRVVLHLPKFRVESDFKLKPALSSLGIREAFVLPGADFSKIDGQKDIFIHDVIHKSFVNVDEEGTEAAAATAVMMGAMSAFDPSQPKTFRADHPFIFLIKDNASGTILFMGRVVNPGK